MTDTSAPERGCPDGGKCHHRCQGACFRVTCCAPLTLHGDEWTSQEFQAELRRAEAARDEALAMVGAVIEEAVGKVFRDDWKAKTECDWIRAKIAHEIRALNPDATAALKRVREEARADALREAAALCDPTSYQAHHASVRRRCRNAILAAIPEKD